MSEKTEPATPDRLRKAREDGDSGVSGYASQAVAFMVAITLLPFTVTALADRAGVLLRGAIGASRGAMPEVSASEAALAVPREVLALTLPVLVAVALTAAVVSGVQAGGAFSTKKLAPDVTRLDLVAGFGRLFAKDRLFSVLRALLTSAVVAWLTYRTLRYAVADLARTAGRLDLATHLAAHAANALARDAAIVGLGVAVLDLVVTRQSWLSRLKMSKDEVKRERKENDGDPEVKAARERANHEVMSAVVVAKVREATVVIVNPTHLACALRYDEKEGDTAPVVVASGRGDLAARIVEAAAAYGVPVLRDVPLARALLELEVGDEIPEALYEAVAEILKLAWEER